MFDELLTGPAMHVTRLARPTVLLWLCFFSLCCCKNFLRFIVLYIFHLVSTSWYLSLHTWHNAFESFLFHTTQNVFKLNFFYPMINPPNFNEPCKNYVSIKWTMIQVISVLLLIMYQYQYRPKRKVLLQTSEL